MEADGRPCLCELARAGAQGAETADISSSRERSGMLLNISSDVRMSDLKNNNKKTKQKKQRVVIKLNGSCHIYLFIAAHLLP